MSIRFSKVSFIVLLMIMFFVAGCSKRKISVEAIKDDKPASTSTTYSDSTSDVGIGKPYSINGIQYIPQKNG